MANIRVGVPLRASSDYQNDLKRCFGHYHRGAFDDALELAAAVAPTIPEHDHHAFAQLMHLTANVEARRAATFDDDVSASPSGEAAATATADAALRRYDDVSEYVAKELGKSDVRHAAVLLNRGIVLLQAGRVVDAERALQGCLALLRSCFSSDHIVAADAHHNLGVLYGRLAAQHAQQPQRDVEDRGRAVAALRSDAKAHLVQSLKVRSGFDDTLHQVDLALVETMTELAMHAWKHESDVQECLEQLHRTLPLARRLPKSRAADVALSALLVHAGAASMAVSSPARAIGLLRQALQLRRARFGSEHPKTREVQVLLDAALQHPTGHKTEHREQ